MKKFVICLFIILYSLFVPKIIFADYVLPYPSYMPGSALYRVSRMTDRLKFYWSWGNIAQVKYHLALSDKYLVEASTLMEYKQFLLGADALGRSDKEFMQLPAFLTGVKMERVDVSRLQRITTQAADKHVEVLTGLLSVVPDQFTWTPEKSSATELPLGAMIRTSMDVRRKIAGQTGSL